MNACPGAGSARGLVFVPTLLAVAVLCGCATPARRPPAATLAGTPAQPNCQAADFLPGKVSETSLPEDGCWNQANLARMVADPGDLVRGRRLGPADARRETLAIEAYQHGQVKTLAGQDSSSAPAVLGLVSPGGNP